MQKDGVEKMNELEIIFIISYFGSFFGTVTAFIFQYILYKRQVKQMEKMKKSILRKVKKIRGK